MLRAHDSRAQRFILFGFFFIVILYALYESRGLLQGPQIYVPEETFVSREASVTIRGRAERIIELRLNGQPITVTEEGNFEEQVLLAPGGNRFVLEARDARERGTRQTIDIIYRPGITETLTPPSQEP